MQVTDCMVPNEILWFGILFAWAFLTTWLAEPIAIYIAEKLRVLDYPNERKVHTEPIPRAGGLAFFFGLIMAPLILFPHDRRVLSFVLGATVIYIFMFIDDWKGLSPYIKLLVQIIAASIVIISGNIRFDFLNLEPLGTFMLSSYGSVLFSLLWIVALTNAVNFIDGLNGLASGVIFISSLSFAIILFLRGYMLVAALAILLAGTSLGFWPYNFPKARTFMGDVGAQLLGFYIGVLTIWGSIKTIGGLLFITYILLFILPLSDLTWSSMRRILKGKHPFYPDKSHLHHMLLKMGISERGVVIIAYIISTLMAAVAIYLVRR